MALAVAMSCSMITGWANTATISQVKVTGTDGYTQTFTDSFENIKIDPSHLVEVTVDIKNDDTTPATEVEATFLSYKDPGAETLVLSDSNIMYVDQATTDKETGKAVFKFRPRTGTTVDAWVGDFIAKAGGTAVTDVDDVAYNVGALAKILGLEAVTAEVFAGGDNIVLNVSCTQNSVGVNVPSFVVTKTSTVDGASAEEIATDSYNYNAENKTLTINNNAFEVGTYNIAISATGYTASANVLVTVKEEEQEVQPDEIPEGKEEETEVALNNATVNVTDNVATLPTEITVGEEKLTVVSEVINKDTLSDVTISGNTVTYNKETATKFAEKVTIVTTVGTGENAKTKTQNIYFVKDDSVPVSFGNVSAIATTAGNDAFASQSNLKEVNEADLNTARADALNIALGKGDKTQVLNWKQSLDFNNNDEIAISEYFIMKRMIEVRDTADDNHTYSVKNIQDNAKQNAGN